MRRPNQKVNGSVKMKNVWAIVNMSNSHRKLITEGRQFCSVSYNMPLKCQKVSTGIEHRRTSSQVQALVITHYLLVKLITWSLCDRGGLGMQTKLYTKWVDLHTTQKAQINKAMQHL